MNKANGDRYSRKSPSCYGFSNIAKIKPGTEANFYEYARKIEAGGVKDDPAMLDVLKLHYLRWNLFEINRGHGPSGWRVQRVDQAGVFQPIDERIFSAPIHSEYALREIVTISWAASDAASPQGLK